MALRIQPRPMEVRQRRPRVEKPDHLQFIRELSCCICGALNPDPAHIRMAAPHLGKRDSGKGEKPDDSWVVPLCREHHDIQHSMSEKSFWSNYRINPFLLALALWHATGDVEIAESILHLNRERSTQ